MLTSEEVNVRGIRKYTKHLIRPRSLRYLINCHGWLGFSFQRSFIFNSLFSCRSRAICVDWDLWYEIPWRAVAHYCVCFSVFLVTPHFPPPPPPPFTQGKSLQHTCMHTRRHTHMHTHTHIHAYIYTHTHLLAISPFDYTLIVFLKYSSRGSGLTFLLDPNPASLHLCLGLGNEWSRMDPTPTFIISLESKS